MKKEHPHLLDIRSVGCSFFIFSSRGFLNRVIRDPGLCFFSQQVQFDRLRVNLFQHLFFLHTALSRNLSYFILQFLPGHRKLLLFRHFIQQQVTADFLHCLTLPFFAPGLLIQSERT